MSVQPTIRKLTLNLPQSRVFGNFTGQLVITGQCVYCWQRFSRRFLCVKDGRFPFS